MKFLSDTSNANTNPPKREDEVEPDNHMILLPYLLVFLVRDKAKSYETAASEIHVPETTKGYAGHRVNR